MRVPGTLPGDGRILYIRLTDKGQKIAKAEQAALHRVD